MFLEEDQGTKEAGVVIQFLPGAVSIGEQVYNYSSSSSEEGEIREREGERENEKVVVTSNNETCSVTDAHVQVSSEQGTCSSEISQTLDLKPEEEDSDACIVSLKLESLSIGQSEPGTRLEISSSESDTRTTEPDARASQPDTHTTQSYTHDSQFDSHTSVTHTTQSDAHASQSDTLTDTCTCSTQSQTATVANSESHNITDSGFNSETVPQITIQHGTPKKSVEVGVFDRSLQQPSAISTPLYCGSRPVSRLSSTASVFEGVFTSSAKHKDGSLIPIVFQVFFYLLVF